MNAEETTDDIGSGVLLVPGWRDGSQGHLMTRAGVVVLKGCERGS